MPASRIVPVALVAALLVTALPQENASAAFEPVAGSAWSIAGKGKVKVKGLPKASEERSALVQFVDGSRVSVTSGESTFFDGTYSGGQLGDDGKVQKKITVTLTPDELATSAEALADEAQAILADRGLDVRPDVVIDTYKVGGKLAKNGDLLKVAVKFKFTASVLGVSRRGVFSAKLKGPHAAGAK